MRIALCLEYPIGQFGGTEVLVRELIQGLSAGHEITLVSPDDPSTLKGSSVSAHLTRHFTWKPREISTAKSRQLAQALAQSGIQIAHFHLGGNYGWGNRFPNHSPIIHLSRLGVRCCSTVHLVVHPLDGYCGPEKPLWFKLAMFPLAWLGKMHTLAHLRREITVSRHDYRKLQRWYFPLRRKFAQIYHSRLRETPAETPPPAREPIIINVGHVATRKGQPILAEAFARLAGRYPEWKLYLIGPIDEPLAGEKIKEIARRHRLEDRIVLTGARTDVLQWMDRAGIYVQPSLKEALGLALQEALFRSCPCIGTTAGGIPELIEHRRTGLLVEPGEPTELAHAIDSLIANPGLRESYGRAGSRSIYERDMTATQMIANHIRLYESLLSESQ